MKEVILLLIVYLIGVALSFFIIARAIRSDVKKEGIIRLKLWQCFVLATIVIMSWVGVLYCCCAYWNSEVIKIKDKEE